MPLAVPKAVGRPCSAQRLASSLQLRAGEALGPCPGPFAAATVLPLDTQQAVWELLAACAEGNAEIPDGSCLTAWALRAESLEPLTARRPEASAIRR